MRAHGIAALFASAIVLWLPSGSVRADNFVNVRYDGQTDELVVTMAYRGTNADHTFSLHWGQCRDSEQGKPTEIVAEVLDDQWKDEARHSFKKTTRFGLAQLHCRPAKVTLRTAPRFYYTLLIPNASATTR
jgi:hypothetical protein